MLGIRKQEPAWSWAAYGKHPSARDFFHIGARFPLAAGFADWIRKGFIPPKQGNGPQPAGCSWRFWAQGNAVRELVCGLLRDSSDSIGRPYPLLIAGGGFFTAWQDRWDRLPHACEGAWRQMEYLASRRYGNLEQLEAELLRTRQPGPDWEEVPPEVGKGGFGGFHGSSSRMNDGVVRLPLEEMAGGRADSIPELVLQAGSAVKASIDRTPSAVFMGGTVDRSFALFFFRAIRPADFSMLWSPDHN